MPTGHTTAQQKKVVNPKPSSKRAREQRSDDGPVILPGMEHFVDLVRKVKRPALVVRLLERASGGTLSELLALADSAKGKLPVESRQAFFHCAAKLDAAIRQRIEDAVERVMLLGDDYGAQAVQSLLDERRDDDAAVLEMPSDRFSRALHLCILQEFPEAGARREVRFDQAEHEQVMHRQWKSEHFSSHYLGPKGVKPKNDGDVQETLRTRIAELFPHVPKDQILIEQFVRHGLSHAQRDDDDDAEGEPLTLLHTVCATFNGSTAHYRQVEDGHVVDHEEPAAMSAHFSWEPATGALTVFCENREARRELATIFRDVVLAHEGAIDDMPIRQFDLFGFSTSAMLKRLEQDRIADIERVEILQIKVAKPFEQPLELGGKSVVRQLASKMEITRDRRDGRNIYQVAYEDYSAEDLTQYALAQVKLVMRMAKQPHRKAHNVAVQITAPNGLNDKSKTEDDRKRVLEQLIRIGVLSEF
ncbi:hypothetical protein [Pseudomonas aeruginosa]|uniref:hypothetical protein n=1 Tax=Pseudomonas aeruginosa TaxID=287 RepID=UPI00071BE310|nr:hypothetical protein [Pseudomonas aeruginosa]KSO09274.1 hypothetical protein APA84_22995 [Pseudomonas aeruginosa]